VPLCARLLQQHVADAEAGRAECLEAIAELLAPMAKAAAAAARAAKAAAVEDGTEEEAAEPEDPSAAVGAAALTGLAALFDPLTGGTLTDEAVCGWLASLLVKP